MKVILILVYDIPRSKGTLRKRIWRRLKNVGASLEFGSSWLLQNSKKNLNVFKNIKKEIIKFGGKAKIIKGEIK